VPKQIALRVKVPHRDQVLVLADCEVTDASGPYELLAYRRGPGTSVRYLQTLVGFSPFWHPHWRAHERVRGALRVTSTRIEFPVAGYSSDSVALCCADVFTDLKWRLWHGRWVEIGGRAPKHRNY
jgi:hypothetical protein